MKRKFKFYLKLYLLIISPVLLISADSFAQGNNQYKWLYPKPQGNGINSIQAINSQVWYGAASGGTFIKTTDGGVTWQEVRGILTDTQNGYARGLSDMHFANSNTGWVCGGAGFLAKTTDAGNTWTGTLAPGVTTLWSDIYFLNDNTGYVVGQAPANIIKTTNGGATWNLLSSLPANGLCVYAFNATKLILGSSSGKVSTSTDGGIAWTTATLPGSSGSTSLYDVEFVNDTLGMIVGRGAVYLSTDGGLNWFSRASGLPSSIFWNDVDFFMKGDSVEAYITGDDSNIYKDVINGGGGVSWEAVDFKEFPSQYQERMYSTDILGDDSLITSGRDGILNKRFTSADRKAFLTRVWDFYLYDVWVSGDDNTIIAPGESGYVLYSTDAGSNWDTTYIGNDPDLEGGINMIDNNTGWVCGYEGAVYKTTNGGLNWTFQANAGSQDLLNISFANSNTGWVVGYNNTVQKTTNGGLNWTAQTSPPGTSDDINDIHMLDANTGFLIGEGGKVNKTTNGGVWVDIGVEPGITINGIFMHDANTGWLCGKSGVLRKTTNGGTTWDSLAVPFPDAILSRLYFTDEWNGMVIGTGGLVFRTRDGGSSWDYNNLGMFNSQGIYMTSSSTAYIAGGFGNIIKYEELLTGNTYTGSEIPGDYILEQNYPNPFNPSTTIKFALPQISSVSLKVYDIAGREVASLFNNEMLNAGTFENRFDASSLSSGIYFYSLVVDNQLVSTKKMLLIK